MHISINDEKGETSVRLFHFLFCCVGNNVYLCTRIHRMLNHKRKEALAFKLSLMRSKRMLYAPNNSKNGEKVLWSVLKSLVHSHDKGILIPVAGRMPAHHIATRPSLECQHRRDILRIYWISRAERAGELMN